MCGCYKLVVCVGNGLRGSHFQQFQRKYADYALNIAVFSRRCRKNTYILTPSLRTQCKNAYILTPIIRIHCSLGSPETITYLGPSGVI